MNKISKRKISTKKTDKKEENIILMSSGKRKMMSMRLRLEYIDLFNEIRNKFKESYYSKISKSDVFEIAIYMLKNFDKLDKNKVREVIDECLRKHE